MEINRAYHETKISEEFPVGSEFTTIKEFYDAFASSAFKNNIAFRVGQRNTKSLSLKCNETDCDFKVSARFILRTSKCVVKCMKPFHKCSLALNIQNQQCLVKNVISQLNVESITPKSIIEKMRTEYRCHISYHSAWSALKSAKKRTGLILPESYSFIPALVTAIQANGDFSEYSMGLNGHFQRFFLMWNASKEFFPTSRKLLYLDGTFLSGPSKGTLLVAVSQDGCDQLVPIAVAIVESENLSSWTWFVGLINRHIELNNQNTIVFSDREKGIISSTNTIAPLASKAYCLRHIAKNLKLNFKDSKSMEYFWKSANTYDSQEFNSNMEILRQKNKSMYDRLNLIGPSTWANSLFPVPRFGKNTTNPVESMNSALKKFIGQDITNLIISINNYSMAIFNERRKKRFPTPLIDKCLKVLNRNMSQGSLLSVEQSNNNIFLVDNRFTVDINNKTCECKVGYDLGIACKHICAVIGTYNLNQIDYVSEHYKSEVYYNSYSWSILPLSNLNLESSELLPPIARRSRGRPRIRRIQAPFETQ